MLIFRQLLLAAASCGAVQLSETEFIAPANGGEFSVTVINNESDPIYVALSFNQTMPHDFDPLPSPGVPASQNLDRAAKKGMQSARTLEGRRALANDVLRTEVHSLIFSLNDPAEIVEDGKESIKECLEMPDPGICPGFKPEMPRYCIPRVSIMSRLGLVVLDYSDTFESCSPDRVMEAIDFLCLNYFLEKGEVEIAEVYDDASAHVVAMAPPGRKTIKAASKTEDHYYHDQWAMTFGRVSEAWAMINPVPANFVPIIEVVDSGAQLDHPDLMDNLWINEAEIFGEEGVDDDGNGYVDDAYGWTAGHPGMLPYDSTGHGTHVTGIIGAVANNAIGVAGVGAVNVKVAVCRRRGEDESSLSGRYASECMDWGLAIGAHISSHSYGSHHGSVRHHKRQAIEKWNEAGRLYVGMAGNDGVDFSNDWYYDACYNVPNQVTVANIGDNKMASDSNHGEECVTLAAPGQDILSTLSADKGAQYGERSGTSMAAPFISGIGALLLNVNPYLNAIEIKRIFRESIRQLNFAARPLTLYGGMPDPVRGIALLRPESVKPADGSRWDDLRFDLREIAPGYETTYQLLSKESPAGFRLGEIVAYSVDPKRNLKVKSLVKADLISGQSNEVPPSRSTETKTKKASETKTKTVAQKVGKTTTEQEAASGNPALDCEAIISSSDESYTLLCQGLCQYYASAPHYCPEGGSSEGLIECVIKSGTHCTRA